MASSLQSLPTSTSRPHSTTISQPHGLLTAITTDNNLTSSQHHNFPISWPPHCNHYRHQPHVLTASQFPNLMASSQPSLHIADSFRSFELGFTAFRLISEKISTAKENFDLKENGKLRYSCFKLC